MMKKCLALSLVCLSLSACIQSVAPPQHYLLNAPTVNAVKQPLFKYPLVIAPVDAPAQWAGTGFMYRLNRYAYQSDYYHRFLIPPQDMMSNILQTSLTNSGFFPDVKSYASPFDHAHNTLKANILLLYADYSDSAHPNAVMVVSTVFYKYDQPHAKKFARVFEERIPLDHKSTDALINAWQLGVDQIVQDLLTELKTAANQ